MNAYSLDLRKKIVAAKERGMPTSEIARTFGVGPLDRQALRRHRARRGAARPQEAPRLQTQAGRGGEEAFGSGYPRTAGSHLTRKARVPEAGGGGFGERLHGISDAQTDGIEKKDRWVPQNATSS
jgi:transposase-like protein